MTLVKINKNICFSEGFGIESNLINTSLDFATVKENIDVYNKKNTFYEKVGECSIHPGINSQYGYNDILNSNFYKLNSFRNDLYESAKIYMYVDQNENVDIANNSELIITDYLNNALRFIFKKDSTVFDGSKDEFGSIIIGIQGLQKASYLQRINMTIKNYLANNRSFYFFVSIDKHNNESLILKQKKPGVLGNIYIVAPEGLVVSENISGKFSNENYEIELEYKPFNENIVIKKNIKDNPKIFKKTLGINNLEYDEHIYFDDSLTKFSNDFYFESPDRIKWNFTYNSKAINSLSTTISPIDTINIIEGNITTEQSLLGIKGEIVSFGKDARERSIVHSNKTNLIPNESYSFTIDSSSNNLYHLEPFNDESFDDLVSIRTKPFKVNYEYQVVQNNNNFVNKLVKIESPRNLTILSNNILVYNEDKMSIVPFYERDRTRKNYLKENEDSYIENENFLYKHFASGRDINSEYSILPESIAYYGEIE